MSCYPPTAGGSDRHLILFGRYPVPGETKTRLIPLLGKVGAAEWHRRQSETAVAKALQNTSIGTVAFSFTGAQQSAVRRWLGHPRLLLKPQGGSDLGHRMRNAMFETLDRLGGRVVLVGTDIPQMTQAHINAAFDALDHHDVVLGPSWDGGYWLVGLKQKNDIFEPIEWGGERVLDQTLSKADKMGVRVTCLSKLNDIDTPSDLMSDRSWDGVVGPYLSVVIPTLNEADTIGGAIRRVRSPECEIIVSDGGSHDETVKIARDTGAIVISGPPGRALQQNAGAAVAKGRVLLFLHADTLVPSDHLRQVFETLLDHRVVAGAFRFKTDFDNPSMRLIEKAAHIRASFFKMPYGDQGLFMSRRTFKTVGGFPLTPIAEDLYLVRRLGRMGDIRLARGVALTSGRRWRQIGVWRGTVINYLIAIGCCLGVDPHKLAPLYRLWTTPRRNPNANTITG